METPFGLLFPQHVDLLRASGISPEVVSARGYVSVDTKATLGRFGFSPTQRSVPGLLLPLWSVAGKKIFSQYRPDTPRIDSNGRQVKYETPPGVSMALDVHPFMCATLGDPSHQLFITEGIRKADSAVTRGLCCIALLGVWNWRGKNKAGGLTALPEWENIALNGRKVFIAFDSDVMSNPQVHTAMSRLRAFLRYREADVFFIYLPPGSRGEKVGLDDYFAAGHTTEQLMALATPDLRESVKRDVADKEPDGPTGPLPDTAALLDGVAGFMRQYVIYATEAQEVADALWILHTYLTGVCATTPYLFVSSPVPGVGKTVSQEARSLLVCNPLPTVNISEAALFRKVDEDAGRITLLIDETDAMFGGRAADRHEDLRALLNAGNRRGAQVLRCVGDDNELMSFSVFCAKCLSGIGTLPPTLADRSVSIRLRMATKEELRTLPRRLATESEGHARPIREALTQWGRAAAPLLWRARPEVPDALTGRQADLWWILLAIADLAGGDWLRLARKAAVELSGERNGQEESLGSVLLRALRDVFEGHTYLLTADILSALIEREDGPWAEWWEKDLAANPAHLKGPGRKLAKLLAPFDIKSRSVRVGEVTGKGYALDDLADAFKRYVPPPPVANVTNDTTTQPQPTAPATDAECDVVTSVTFPGDRDAIVEQAIRLFKARVIEVRPVD